MIGERFLGCLLGGALGDALGYPLEFVRNEVELEQLRQAAAFEGLVSDDTQMTLFSAEALVRMRLAGASDPVPFALGAYQRWFTTQGMPQSQRLAKTGHGLLLADERLYARRAPGQTCLGALAASFMQARFASVAQPPNYSKGCGAVMRAAPFGLAAPSRELAFAWARDSGVLTHGHPSGFLSAAYLAALVHDLARGVELREALPLADALLEAEPENAELCAVLAKARELPSTLTSSQLVAEVGEGWVGEEALALGVACALGVAADGVEAALWRAVAHVGDSDSSGSIAGNLLGARYGVGALPSAWLAKLELADVIERVAADLHCVTLRGDDGDLLAYPPVSGVAGPPPARLNAT